MQQSKDRITSTYIHNLQAIYHKISNRGICLNKDKIKDALKFIEEETLKECEIASKQWGLQVYVGSKNKPAKDIKSVNINASSGDSSLLKTLQDIGYKIPKINKKDEDGNYEQKYSTSELALQKMLVTNQFGHPGGDPAIAAILNIREMGKLKSSYFGCNFYYSPDVNLLYLSNYNCAGTLTGRRSSKKHAYGFGNNAQNFPKHGKLAKVFRRCLIARPGNIFLMVDQKGAELWPVYALAGDLEAIHELESGINRHIKRAAGVFKIPISSRTEGEWKDSIEYYLGKKIGHALNYGMRGNRMADSLAQEGKSIPATVCQQLLNTANSLEPKIDGVFHKYVQETLRKTRILTTPFGRERQFLGLRPNDENYKIFNEAYSYIPQSTVGDNTGFAASYLESDNTLAPAIIQEGHDSIVQDIPADAEIIWKYLNRTMDSFHRKIKFYNGIELEIPIEAELGYNFADTVKIAEPLCYEHVLIALEKLNQKYGTPT